MNRLSARSWRLLAAIGFWLLLGAAFATGGAMGLLLGYASAAWLAAFSLGAWRRQDEFERAAQKFSWVFGGLFGLLGSLALLPLILQPDVLDPLLGLIENALGGSERPPHPAAPAIVLGAIWIVLGQLVGFLVCWVGWHVTKQ